MFKFLLQVLFVFAALLAMASAIPYWEKCQPDGSMSECEGPKFCYKEAGWAVGICKP